MIMAGLTLFYDRNCAICANEMQRLARWDAAGSLRLLDISAPGFDAADYGLTSAALDRELHGISADGRVLRGLECVRRAYALTRYGWLWRITALPLFKSGFDRFYLWFARNRYAISRYVHRAHAQEAATGGDRQDGSCGGACTRKLSGTST